MFYLILSIVLMIFTRYLTLYLLKPKSRISDGDAIGHLQIVSGVYKSRGEIPDFSKKYLLDKSDYPFNFHRLFYFLKIKPSYLEEYGGFIPTIFDAFLLLVIGITIQYMKGEMAWLLFFPFMRLLIYNIGRAFHFNERAYGVFWGNVFLACEVLYYLYGNFILLIIAAIAFCFFSTSSQFTWQGTLFVSLFLSIFTLSPFFILLYIGCFVVSIVLTGGHSLKVLRGLIRHWIYFKTYLSKRYIGLHDFYADFFNTFKGYNKEKLIFSYMHNPLFKLVSALPINILVIYQIIQFGLPNNIFVFWYLSGILLVIFIATNTLKFWGEPERYMEYTIIPAFVVLSQYDHPPLFLTIFVIVITAITYRFHWRFVKLEMRSNSAKENAMLGLASFFKRKNKKTILTIPLRLSFLLGYYNESNKYVTMFSNIGEGKTQDDYKELVPDYYPFPGRRLAFYRDKYKIDYLVVDNESEKVINGIWGKAYYSFKGYKNVYFNDYYIVYKMKND